jgi:hypothetical protein
VVVHANLIRIKSVDAFGECFHGAETSPKTGLILEALRFNGAPDRCRERDTRPNPGRFL